MKAIISTLVLTGVLIASCNSNDPDPQNPDGSVTVYLAGSDYSVGDGSYPNYWKGNTKTVLPNLAGGDAYDIVVDGQNVLVAGRYWESSAQTRSLPCYWISDDRKELELLDERGVGIARSITSFNASMYVAGSCTDSLEFFANNGWRNIPCYWKDKKVVPLNLLNGFGNGKASSVAMILSDGKITPFVAGTSTGEEGLDDPCYWKVGNSGVVTPGFEIEATPLSTKGFGGEALGIASGNPNIQAITALYIAGFVMNEDEYSDPCYWTGDSRTDLSKISELDNGIAYAVEYAEGSVYVAGYTGDGNSFIPCVWKNGTRTDLPLSVNAYGGEATDCKILDGDVYVSGTIFTPNGELPCYWKNGELVMHNSLGIAKSVDVVKN